MEVGEDVLDPQLVEQPLQDPMLTSHQQCWPCRADRNSKILLTTSNMQLTECQVEPPDSCRPVMQIMPWLHALWCCPVGLCLLAYDRSLFDSLNDPFAVMTSHDVLYGSIPMYEEPLTFGVQRDRILDLATVPEAPETRKLFLAWELPISSVLRETGRSSAAEGPTWMAGTHTGGPSLCPR